MPGQATVTINSKQWAVSVATTPSELSQGLSGVSSLLPSTGILFDLGSDQAYIPIDMSQMLFALDIVFINSISGVVSVVRNVQPGTNVDFQVLDGLGARCFLEINSGEAEGVEVGDSVNIQQVGNQVVTPAFWGGLAIVAVAALMAPAVIKQIKG